MLGGSEIKSLKGLCNWTNVLTIELLFLLCKMIVPVTLGGNCSYMCNNVMCFNLFFYLFTRSAIQTVAKTQNIFILGRNSNMDGDMYNAFLFNQQYQTRNTNAHQSGPSGLIIYPGYQQLHPINVSTSHDESRARSESPSGSSGSGSEHVSKRWEATLVKIDPYLCIQRQP